MCERHASQLGRLQFVSLAAVVLAFMAISLVITATGTARFAVAMGYPADVGYAVGGVFDLAKSLLPIALFALFARRALPIFAFIATAWLGLIAFSVLATEATISRAIGEIERSSLWKMESRSGVMAELDVIEKRLAVLSQPAPPRPSATVAGVLAAEKVPVAVWRDSRECQNIRDSKYFQSACASVSELRRELAAAKDFERLDSRTVELRRALAEMPIIPTSDALPEAFSATLGRVIPVDGRVGIAIILTVVIEIMSSIGLAAVRAVGSQSNRDEHRVDGAERRLTKGTNGRGDDEHFCCAGEDYPNAFPIIPVTSLRPENIGDQSDRRSTRDLALGTNVVSMETRGERKSRAGKGDAVPLDQTLTSRIDSHVPEFVRARLRTSVGTSLSAAELKALYESWCVGLGYEPVSQRRLGSELNAFGFARRKSCGVIWYKDLRSA